jgi:hypothetical protein
VADVLQTRAYETERLVFISLLELIDALDRLFVHNIATDAIVSVGRINDNASGLKNLHRLVDQALLWIYRVDFQQHDIICVFLPQS